MKIKLPSISENADLKKEYIYSSDFELDVNKPLGIGVHAPYEFTILNGITIVISTKVKEKMFAGENVKDKDFKARLLDLSHLYNPFEIFDIETVINVVMNIDLENIDSILHFYNQYGILTYEDFGTEQGKIYNISTRTFGVHLNTSYEIFDFFKHEMKKLQELISIYEYMQNEKYDLLRKQLSESSFKFIYSTEVTEKTTVDELISLGNKTLLLGVNEKSDLINIVVRLTNGERTKATTSSCLLGVFYLRFLDLITENAKIKRCHYCGDYFKPRKSDADFCPPETPGKRSKCLNQFEQMKRRIADYYYNKNLNIEEIQEKIRKPKTRSKQEIENILANYHGKLKK